MNDETVQLDSDVSLVLPLYIVMASRMTTQVAGVFVSPLWRASDNRNGVALTTNTN